MNTDISIRKRKIPLCIHSGRRDVGCLQNLYFTVLVKQEVIKPETAEKKILNDAAQLTEVKTELLMMVFP